MRVVFVWACGGKDRALAGVWDNVPMGCRFAGNMSIRVEIEDGRRKAKVESCGLGDQVAWET